MAFLRSLFSGVSALRNHQIMMDVIGNNIANVNTVGFKSGRATFSEMYAQTLRGASRPTDTLGGTNPMQVGLGMAVNTLDTQFTQGSVENTGNPYDLALVGSSFFIVKQSGQTMYTRAGDFLPDANGRLVNGSGAVLQGKMADAQGVISQGTALQDIIIDSAIKSPARATSKISYSGNLDSSSAVYNAGPPPTGGIYKTNVSAFDSLGNQMTLTLEFTKSGENTWNWAASIPGASSTAPGIPVGQGTVSFDTNGRLAGTTGSPITFAPPAGAAPMSIALDFGTVGEFSGLTQTGTSSAVSLKSQDGYTSGTLKNISIDQYGQISGSFTNDTLQTLGQIMLADFGNPGGLMKAGSNLFSITGNSGNPSIISAGETSEIYAGALEQSNVDLADEFTKMITAQRGFQASARVITTSDEFLQELVNLKR